MKSSTRLIVFIVAILLLTAFVVYRSVYPVEVIPSDENATPQAETTTPSPTPTTPAHTFQYDASSTVSTAPAQDTGVYIDNQPSCDIVKELVKNNDPRVEPYKTKLPKNQLDCNHFLGKIGYWGRM